MIEPATRLALALPLLLLALGGVLVAARRGLIRLPGAVVGVAPLKIIQFAALGPGARLAVVEFEGERLLLSVGKGGVTSLLPSPCGGERETRICAARGGDDPELGGRIPSPDRLRRRSPSPDGGG